jgi:hypothetical protein
VLVYTAQTTGMCSRRLSISEIASGVKCAPDGHDLGD